MVFEPVRKLSERWDFKPPSGVKAVLLIIFYSLVIALTAGVFNGYGQLHPILVASGIYGDLCPGNCTKTTSR